MAVKSSGQLSLRYDIAREVNGASSNIRLRTLSSQAGFSTPDRMSDFYGYSSAPPNTFGWLGRDTFFRNVIRQPAGIFNGGVTLMAWFKSNVTTLKNQRLFAVGGNPRIGRNEFRVHYIASLNRISLEVWDNTGILRIRRQYPLHSGGNNGEVTGVTNSRIGWTRDQPGNVDPTTGLAHITATWDGPLAGGGQFPGLRLYWRGVELTYSVNNNSTSNLTTADGVYIAVRNIVASGLSASTFDGYTDNFGVFTRALTEAEVLSVFNNGNVNVESAVQSSGIDIAELAYYQGFEGNLTNEEGGAVGYTLQLNGSNGAFTPYP